ncbi:uncharacterized protein LOC100878980 isoform X2 [Megachile rotundata]|uniref:uncharacterized protein LOC100878980 isoform X2 n=1 Tax=Megachile rotundata TaxID=143995 RepID=UPI003FD4CAF7
MYDFNMAYQDNANAVQLDIKVNSNNLLPFTQKYNAGSLRIPADPSWPKIPQRKLVNDIDDTIESPCIITLTGTPRKSRTFVQTQLNQSPKSVRTKDSAYSSFCHQRITTSMHTLKRIPGYVDPRFKKVTNVKRNQDTSTSTNCLQNKEIEKSIAERDTDTGQTKKEEAEKPHEKSEPSSILCDSECAKQNINIQDNKENVKLNINNIESRNEDNISKNINKCETTEKDKCVKCSPELTLKSTVNDANTQVDITSLPIQENNGQLFFVLDKNLQSHPLNPIHLDTITIPQECVKQCYNVQVPVLTYQNIPMQVATAGTSSVIPQCLNSSEHKGQNNNILSMKNESEVPVHFINEKLSNECIQKPVDQVQQEDTIQDTILKTQDTKLDKNKSNKPDCLENPNTPENLQSTNIQHKHQESSDSEYYIPNIHKRNKYTNVLRMKRECNTSGEETTDSEFISRKSIQQKDFPDNDKLATKTVKMNTDTIHGDVKISFQNQDQVNIMSKAAKHPQLVPRSNVIDKNRNEYKKIMSEVKPRNKSEQNLLCVKDEYKRKIYHNSEPHITFKQKKVSGKFSRKAKSYFQKNSHSALVDSDYTMMWPDCQHSRHKRNETNTHKSSNDKTKKFDQQVVNTLNSNELSVQHDENIDSCHEGTANCSKTCLQKECCKCEVSPRSNTDDAIERPKSIPPKTQELLNKSYWEFYNKLKHKINDVGQEFSYQLTMDKLEKAPKGKSNEVYNQKLRSQLKLNPELQTLQQCSALSSMINKALDTNLQSDIMQTKQLYVNDNMKSLSNPVGAVQNVNMKQMVSNLNNDEHMVNKVKYKQTQVNDKQFLELKSIIFFGGMMYILIIFLPMLYDYFYHQEYDDYENVSYLELIVEYILSSFKEAFGDVCNGVKKVFLYLHSCKKCTNSS